MKDELSPTQGNIEKLLVDLWRAKEQDFSGEVAGYGWICPTISKAIICITLLQDRIHELENDKEYLKLEIEDLKAGIVN